MDTLVGSGHLEAARNVARPNVRQSSMLPRGAVAMPPVNQNLLMDTHVEFEISFVIAKRRATSMIDRKVNASVDHL